MDKRSKVGLDFSYNEDWVAGSYYILNLIMSLNQIPDIKKPFLYIYCSNQSDIPIIKSINYPYLEINFSRRNYHPADYHKILNFINQISLHLFKYLIFDNRPTMKTLDMILLNPGKKYYFEKIPDKKKLFWIPDFQEHYLKQFFSMQEVKNRKELQSKLIKRNVRFVFSSESCQNDFHKIYPNAQNLNYVLNFAVHHPEYDHIEINQLLHKYRIKEKYFFSPNQFWAHKNHIVTIKAVKLLKDNGTDINVVFTGKMSDYRSPNYSAELVDYVKRNNLTENISFLGFIDRAEQLQLMKNAISVIQPSLFEGWSTVVEDAKSMNQHIILSDINVHREQTKFNRVFFDANNAEELALEMNKIWLNPPRITHHSYSESINRFSNNFLSIVDDFKNN